MFHMHSTADLLKVDEKKFEFRIVHFCEIMQLAIAGVVKTTFYVSAGTF